MSNGSFSANFEDVWLLEGCRTPFVDYCGALGGVSPTDLGIKVAREALTRSGVDGADIGSVIAGSMAHTDPVLQSYLPQDRLWHYGLAAVGALLVLALGRAMLHRRASAAAPG